MPAAQDAPLETLLLPFANGSLRWPTGRALFLRARAGWPLREQVRGELLCEQSFRPFAQALERDGWPVVSCQRSDAGPAPALDSHRRGADIARTASLGDGPRLALQADGGAHDRHLNADATLADEAALDAGDERFELVLVLPPRQREEARALFARALALVAPGGIVVACQANNEGARSGEGDLQQLAGLGGKLTKNHCRVYWTAPQAGGHDAALLARWRTLDAPRPILDGRFLSRPGIFAWDRLDPASQLLAGQLPATLAGRGADLGAGYGYLSAHVLAHCPEVTALDLYEAEARALALARRNLEPVAGDVALDYRWHDVTAGIDPGYDFIVSNPPFHTPARADRPDIGQRFIAVAAQALRPGGQLWLVANRHLPYEQVLNDSFGQVRVAAERDGFKVIAATRSGRGA
ncbi:class I SAM-dependent methyltransferase [Stenotrophomonas sp. MMGLT7]|uniref:class I SAM-dependent methyltransferase n=1 Tax=Stenotrophomonas sp. MMGLT7 TaxID=2901227 RepID=UPI001E61D21F|nr:class I SAM-dependent methyltransferase [Stenotrophomonas sp. MMGLT7]MCD7099275.1 class I SAM-dependent methyltransferase [Stenotrophomonas sp. MMGLT7]